MLSVTPKKKNFKVNTFWLQLCILVKHHVQKLHHNSKTIHLIWTLSDTPFTTGKPFSTHASKKILLHSWCWESGRFLPCLSLVSSRSYMTSVLVCLACRALPLNSASSLLTGQELLSRGFTETTQHVLGTSTDRIFRLFSNLWDSGLACE